jgi:hypothetical protein
MFKSRVNKAFTSQTAYTYDILPKKLLSQQTSEIPLMPQSLQNPKFAFLGGKSPKLATLTSAAQLSYANTKCNATE